MWSKFVQFRMFCKSHLDEIWGAVFCHIIPRWLYFGDVRRHVIQWLRYYLISQWRGRGRLQLEIMIRLLGTKYSHFMPNMQNTEICSISGEGVWQTEHVKRCGNVLRNNILRRLNPTPTQTKHVSKQYFQCFTWMFVIDGKIRLIPEHCFGNIANSYSQQILVFPSRLVWKAISWRASPTWSIPLFFRGSCQIWAKKTLAFANQVNPWKRSGNGINARVKGSDWPIATP